MNSEAIVQKTSTLLAIRAAVRFLIRVFLACIRDSHTIPHNCPTPPLATLAWRTLRYRTAGIGMFLTANERRLASYKNQHKGQRAFLLGNGPSLNRCDLRFLKNEITFGVNSIFLNYKNMGFYTKYFVVEDVFVGEDRAKEINAYKGPEKFFPNYFEEARNCFL